MTPAEYRTQRIALGHSQTTLGRVLGVTRETISRREAGHPQHPISTEAAYAIKAAPSMAEVRKGAGK